MGIFDQATSTAVVPGTVLDTLDDSAAPVAIAVPEGRGGRIVSRPLARGRTRSGIDAIPAGGGPPDATVAGDSTDPAPLPARTRTLKQPAINGGFVELSGETPRRIFAQLQAQEKCGKTHFCCTMPGPIAAITTDTGTEEVARKFKRETGKQFYIKHIDVPREIKGTKLGQNVDKYEKYWDEVEDSVDWVLGNMSIRSLFIDTVTEIWEIMRLARFGKLTQVNPQHYSTVNREMSDWLKKIYRVRPDLNVIFISKVKKEYKAMKTKDDTAWNGKYERAGFGDLAYIARMNLECYYVRARTETDAVTGVENVIEPGRFAMHVMDCGENPEVIGLRMFQPELDFATLAVNVFPDSDFPDWE